MSNEPENNGGPWQEKLRPASPFVILCGIIAIFYFAYRIILVAYPVAVLENNVLNPTRDASSVVCGHEEGDDIKDPAPILSSAYQQRISSQKALTNNRITNPSLSDIDQTSNQPIGYTHNIDNATSKYEHLRDPLDRSYFLRVNDSNKMRAGSASAPAWIPNSVAVTPKRAYAYGFEYRSNVPVQVAIEYTVDGNNDTNQTSVVTLNPSTVWQAFTAHIDNTNNITSFRIIVTGASPGQTDTRAFKVHQIPDAKLPKGIVSVTFDDGWQSVNTEATDLLKQYGIRSTQYVVSSVADLNVEGYMDITTLKRLKDAGHEIGSHSLTHCNQTLLSPTSMSDNASFSKEVLESRGLGPIKSFAYPLGQYNQATQDIFTKQYPLIRTSDFGYNDRYFDETNIRSMGIVETTSEIEFKAWLDYAREHRVWLVLVYHRINESGEYNVTTQQLDKQLKMVSESDLLVLPMSEAAQYARH